jgi:cyclophilin family peptidyl-prolyl cis-trans isomerase
VFVNDDIRLKALAERQYNAAPPMTVDKDARYLARVEMGSGDTFVIELYPQSAPQTVNSFIFLTNEGWFDGVTFHRVLPGFVAQTGDPSGTGRGGPGYNIPNEIDRKLTHRDEGIVAMANAGPNTNGSQWYITLADAAFLDGSYTIFGRVTEGLDKVKKITPRDPSRNPNAPAGDRITRITIEEVE